MNISDLCIRALAKEGLFQNSMHRTRMKELLDSFSDKPFFNKGICKCMYMSAWDDEHFVVLLEMLNIMAIGGHDDTIDMQVDGESHIEESDESQSPLYQLSYSFITGLPYEGPSSSEVPEETRYIMERTFEASDVIDSLF